jgi:hypothetical protein
MRQTSGKAEGQLDDIHLKSQRKFYEAIRLNLFLGQLQCDRNLPTFWTTKPPFCT